MAERAEALLREAVAKAVTDGLETVRRHAARLPIERGLVSGVEYIPLRGNAPRDLETLIDAAIEGARAVADG